MKRHRSKSYVPEPAGGKFCPVFSRIVSGSCCRCFSDTASPTPRLPAGRVTGSGGRVDRCVRRFECPVSRVSCRSEGNGVRVFLRTVSEKNGRAETLPVAVSFCRMRGKSRTREKYRGAVRYGVSVLFASVRGGPAVFGGGAFRHGMSERKSFRKVLLNGPGNRDVKGRSGSLLRCGPCRPVVGILRRVYSCCFRV